MYTSFYNLAETPFTINTDPRFLWLGDKHREALAHLNYGLMEADGYVVLTGDVGVGKTTLVNALLEGVDDTTLTVNLSHPSLSIMEFFRFFAKTLGEPKDLASKVEYLFFFEEALLKTHNEGRKVLLIIDEAHKLSEELLEEIRLLSNIEHQGMRLINIFFVGQNELKDILLNPQFRALRQRITLFYDIKPLTAAETASYIKHRLKVAGGDGEVFTAEAATAVHEFSKGYPRLINTLCGRSMLTGYINEQHTIDAAIVRECRRELDYLDPTQSSQPIPASKATERAGEGHTVAAPPRPKPSPQRQREQEKPVKPAQDIRVTPQAGKKGEEVQIEAPEPPMEGRRRLKMPDRVGNIVAIFIIFGILVFYLFFENNGSLSWLSQKNETGAQTELTQDDSPTQQRSFENDSPPDISMTKNPGVVGDRNSEQETTFEQGGEGAFATQQTAPDPAEERFSAANERAQQEASAIVEETIAVSPGDNEAIDRAITGNNRGLRATESVAGAAVEPESGPVAETEPESVAEPDPEPSPTPPTAVELATAALFNKQYQTVLDLLDAEEATSEEQRAMHAVLYNKALLGKAEQLMARFPQEAKKLLRQVVETDDTNGRAFFLLGKLHTEDKEYAQAINVYQQAARLDPTFPDSFFNLGFLYATTGMYEDAERLFKQAVDLEPEYLGKALFNLAVIQQRLGKNEESLANLRKAGELDPQNEKVKEYLQQAEITESR